MHVNRNAAKVLLRSLDDAQQLRENPLLTRYAEFSHEERRAIVLRAVDQLNPGELQGVHLDRRRRRHAILLRCDVYGESQEAVAGALGLSMRQFFRDRSEAFEDFVAALHAQPAVRRTQQGSLSDVFAMRERFIQKLRGCGQHERVWIEAAAFATELDQDVRAVEFWSVAAEGARYMGDLAKSAEAIAMAKRVRDAGASPRAVATDILITIPEIALDWTSGRYAGAAQRLDDAMRRHGYGRALAELDATLFGIMLTYGVSIEIERGQWERARLLLRHLEDVGGRIDERHTFPSRRRHAGRVALRGHDADRAIVDLREAVAVAQRFDNLAAEAGAATDLGMALADRAPAEAEGYLQYGLSIGRKVLGRNEYAMLALGALPAICRCSGARAALAELEAVARGSHLAERAQMAVQRAELALLVQQRNFRSVLERAQPLAELLERRGLVAPAGEAMLMAVAAHAATGRRSTARRLFRESVELIKACGQSAWPWAESLGSNLAVGLT